MPTPAVPPDARAAIRDHGPVAIDAVNMLHRDTACPRLLSLGGLDVDAVADQLLAGARLRPRVTPCTRCDPSGSLDSWHDIVRDFGYLVTSRTPRAVLTPGWLRTDLATPAPACCSPGLAAEFWWQIAQPLAPALDAIAARATHEYLTASDPHAGRSRRHALLLSPGQLERDPHSDLSALLHSQHAWTGTGEWERPALTVFHLPHDVALEAAACSRAPVLVLPASQLTTGAWRVLAAVLESGFVDAGDEQALFAALPDLLTVARAAAA